MHGAWFIVLWAWAAIFIAYLLLYVVAGERLSGSAKKRADATFWVVVALGVLRMSIRFALGSDLIYRCAVLFVGIAAGVAVLDLARMLVEHGREGRIVGTGNKLSSD